MIVAVSPTNQLGNRLFNHAHLMAAAWELDTRFVNPWFGEYARLFPAMRNDPLCAGLPGVFPERVASSLRRLAGRGASLLWTLDRKLETRGGLPTTRRILSGSQTTLMDRGGIVYVDRDPFVSAVSSSRLVLVRGALFRFANRERFLDWRPRIAEFFRWPNAVTARAVTRAAIARRGRETLIGVHVRRGDYAGFAGGAHFHSWDVYERLMMNLHDAWGGDRVAFLVAGDEPPPPAFAADLRWSAAPGDVPGDMAALGCCDYIVGPPSTFNRWAAFVSGTPLHSMVDPTFVPDRGDFALPDG